MRQTPDWLPYFAPMIAFALILQVGEYAPASAALAVMAARVLAPLAVFVYFLRLGSYPELKGFSLSGWNLADVAVGLGVAALWMAPYVWWPDLRPEDAGDAFNAGAAGEGLRTAMLALRFAGFALVTPFIEELLVRSYLLREAEVYNSDRSFRSIPVGKFAWTGFMVTLVWFTFTHLEWEWPVAAATCVIYNVWLYRRRHMGALILTHSVTNAALFAAVLWADRTGRDWWFFL
ncbi:MAG: CAAX prenyl protease-related protein [Acidobacteria bacterium]|nr:CAAX prenyl protease-related protein [Acidobacteriota bacterium]MDA1234776.1 CAAX prenyl protease-related protein [Acidobacteriota bacterium]